MYSFKASYDVLLSGIAYQQYDVELADAIQMPRLTVKKKKSAEKSSVHPNVYTKHVQIPT